MVEELKEDKLNYNMKTTKRLSEQIKLEMDRIEKMNPEETVLQVSCNEDANLSSTFGKNNGAIHWGLSYINLEYLTELLEKTDIEILPNFDQNKKLTNISFVVDCRTEEEKEMIKEEPMVQEELIEELQIEEVTPNTGKTGKTFEDLTEEVLEYLRPPVYHETKFFKNFIKDMKECLEELGVLDSNKKPKQKRFGRRHKKLRKLEESESMVEPITVEETFIEEEIEPVMEVNTIEEVVLVEEKKEPIIEMPTTKSKEITEILCNNIVAAMIRIEKNYPDELVIKINANPIAKLTNCLGENNSSINRSLHNIDINYLSEICDRNGIEMNPKFENGNLVNIEFVRDYRTEEEIKQDMKKNQQKLTSAQIIEELKKEMMQMTTENEIKELLEKPKVKKFSFFQK